MEDGSEAQAQSFADKAKAFLKNPVFIIIAIGLAIRLACAPIFAYGFDIYHWGVIMQNINSGNGLYELTGYFYTPVWGYIMGFIDACWNNFLSIDVYGIRFTDLFAIEELSYKFHTATITSPEFNLALKVPLIICDLVVGYLLYWLVYQKTEDKRKCMLALALWFLCPVVIYMSGVQAMFDTFSALLMLITTILFLKKNYLLGGFVFAFAVLLKFFPGFCIFVLIAYVLVNSNDKKEAVQGVIKAAIGGLMGALLIFVPQIMDGTVIDTLMFALGRMGSSGDMVTSLYTATFTILELVMMVLFAIILYKKGREESDRYLFECIMCVLLGAVLIQPSPQYPIVAIPFLAYVIVTSDQKYSICWWLIGIFSCLSGLAMNSYSLLASVSEFWGWFPPESIIAGMQWMDGQFLGVTRMVWIDGTVGEFEWLGCALVIVFFFRESIAKHLPRVSKVVEWFRNRGVIHVE
jgi:hypothetical protein